MGTNKTIATLRKDGSPRLSGSELEFDDGEVTFGMMGGSMKLLDVRRDPRIAVHSPTVEPPPTDGGCSGPTDAPDARSSADPVVSDALSGAEADARCAAAAPLKLD
jgi:hypothetical protein